MANQFGATDNSSEITRYLAEWTHDWSTDDVDLDVRQAARHCLLDWMGVTLGGIDDESAYIARAEVLEQGGADHATIVGAVSYRHHERSPGERDSGTHWILMTFTTAPCTRRSSR